MQFDYFKQLSRDMEMIQKDTMAFNPIHKKVNAKKSTNC